MYFIEKYHQESEQIEEELVTLNSKTLCLSEATEVLNKTSVNISSEFIVQKKHLSRISELFDNKCEHISVSIIEATN